MLPDCHEDCLYLNVTAPTEVAPAAGYPVVFWIHGGGYTRGTGSGGAVRDGATLARRGIVVVTINYRLGAFGYLSLADVLDGEEDSGAAGLLDQVAALRWVVDNIAAFGGDPARITLYGVSAGAKGVTNLLASPLTAGLATRAISSSGGEFLATGDQAASSRRRLFRELGLTDSDATRIRDVAAADLLAAQEAIARGPSGTWIWRPVRTERVLPQAPLEALAAGSADGVALLVGNNANEGITFQTLDPSTATQAARVLTGLFGPDEGASLLRDYAAAGPDLDETGIGLAIFADERYGVPTQRLADTQAGHGEVWRYRFDGAPPGVADTYLGGHGLDLGMVWAADLMGGGDNPRARLARLMADTWAGFIQGNPPPWAPYDPEPAAHDDPVRRAAHRSGAPLRAAEPVGRPDVATWLVVRDRRRDLSRWFWSGPGPGGIVWVHGLQAARTDRFAGFPALPGHHDLRIAE